MFNLVQNFIHFAAAVLLLLIHCRVYRLLSSISDSRQQLELLVIVQVGLRTLKLLEVSNQQLQ